MTTLITPSWRYYKRIYGLVALAVLILMSVLSGSLLLGDSVRGTLARRVSERLGDTETIVASGTGFLSVEMLHHPLFSDARGYLLMDGFVSDGGKMIPVYVWGSMSDSLPEGHALVNQPLQEKLGKDKDIVLHLPSLSLMPSGSLFVTKSYATQMRLHVDGVKTVEQGGNMLLRNEQTRPLNIFVSQRELAESMSLQGKVNLILSPHNLSEQQVCSTWKPLYSGLHLNDSSLVSDRIFIQPRVVEAMALDKSLYFAYLVNDITHSKDTVPYSFVTAVTHWRGEPLRKGEVILTDYAACRLKAERGDTVSMSYFLSHDLKNLDQGEQVFRVKDIVPLAELQQDSLLFAEFPGLSNVERCTDWDSDLPIRMERVGKVDEDFWYAHRQTPKAIVAYESVVDDWSNTYGRATAIRFTSGMKQAAVMEDSLRSIHSQFFVVQNNLHGQGIAAANGGTDFSTLFLALGFFIIVAAILLMLNPLTEMYQMRQDELLLYRQMGYRKGQLFRMYFTESFSLILLVSPLGILLGLLYSGLTLWLLSNVWSGATHTEGFTLHVHFLTLLISWIVGLTTCGVSLYMIIRKHLSFNVVKKDIKQPDKRYSFLMWLLLGTTIILVAYNFLCLHSMALFVICGLLWIVTFGLFLQHVLERKTREQRASGWDLGQLIWQSVFAHRKAHMLAYWTLSMGVFTVFCVGLNRPDFSDASRLTQVTGGYQTFIESRVPIRYDLNNDAVRRKLALQDLPDSTRFLHFLRHTQDEASCLNLNKVSTPTVLGIDLQSMRPFGLEASTATSSLPRIYLDEESLLWSLMRSVGDTLYYDTQLGKHTPVVIAGSYPTGIFHGNALMSREDFLRLWHDETGIEVLLMRSPHPEKACEILATAMSPYGLNIQSAHQRIEMFFEVTRTYLIIFLSLGALGLLLGIFSMFIILRKNLTAQAPAITQFSALGYSADRIRGLLIRENVFVPLYAIVTGTLGSIISISANVAGAGIVTILVSLLLFLLLLALVYYGIRHTIAKVDMDT